MSSYKPIGGYFELELPIGNSFHENAIALNTGRNALEYILRQHTFNRVYLPHFFCDVLLEPLNKLGVKYEFYHIDNLLDPIIDFEVAHNECLLYINYFGVKDKTVASLISSVDNLIIDNCQSFFSKPGSNLATFYSCRKFFGVPDGAYAYINGSSSSPLAVDHSYNRFAHLAKRIDVGAEAGYADYAANEELLKGQDVKKMSLVTGRILAAIDYASINQKRQMNFNYLHQRLRGSNELAIGSFGTPMVYPFLTSKNIREKLIENKIFAATYWPNVLANTAQGSWEYYLANNLIALPIDQRYDISDMEVIVNKIINHINEL